MNFQTSISYSVRGWDFGKSACETWIVCLGKLLYLRLLYITMKDTELDGVLWAVSYRDVSALFHYTAVIICYMCMQHYICT